MTPRRVIVLALGFAISATVAKAPASCPTSAAGQPVPVCDLQDARITEASGLVASRLNPGCFYVHNDSGDEARIFLIDRTGRTRLTVRLKGATAIDCEDIALTLGAKPGTWDVCLADVGDNAEKRGHVTIYRFAEVSLNDQKSDTVDVEAVAYRLRYAGGPANVEAFAVHPRTGDGYLFTKRVDGRSYVYKLAAPWDAKQETVLPRVAMLELPQAEPLARVVTAADIGPDGRRLALRCYADGREYRLPESAADGDFARIFQSAPERLSLAAEPQGEAICYSPDGSALFTVSEGVAPTLYEYPVPAARPSAPSQPAKERGP